MKTTNELHTTEDFRLYLNQTLVEKIRKNPKFSLRAFAKQLELEPSFLSKLISGKRSITMATISKLAPKLGLNPAEVQRFNDTLNAPTENHAAKNYNQLTLDAFQVIADWYHYAILELTATSGFDSDVKAIAKSLGITVIEARDALERLERLELIEKNSDGAWTATTGNSSTVANPFSAGAFRKLQKQILEQAMVALEATPIEERDQSSMTMAIDAALLPEAKEKIKSFRRELCGFLQKNPKNLDRVYNLSISLFPVSIKNGVQS